MKRIPQVKMMGEKAILVEFEPEINEELLRHLLILKNFLHKKLIKEEVEVKNTYRSLLISYAFTIEDPYGAVSEVEQLLSEANVQNKIQNHIFRIPVCYTKDFALDLDHISQVKKLSKKAIIELHSAPVYTVYFSGFLPGFLYLGGLDKKLQISRRDQPRLEVQKGAVGIGEKQTGIYPQKSPGGWQIIGNSPVPLFDQNSDPPCEISAGDKIKFYPVDLREHQRISEAVARGEFQFQKEIYEG